MPPSTSTSPTRRQISCPDKESLSWSGPGPPPARAAAKPASDDSRRNRKAQHLRRQPGRIMCQPAPQRGACTPESSTAGLDPSARSGPAQLTPTESRLIDPSPLHRTANLIGTVEPAAPRGTRASRWRSLLPLRHHCANQCSGDDGGAPVPPASTGATGSPPRGAIAASLRVERAEDSAGSVP